MSGIAPGDFEFISRLVKDEAAIFLEKGKEYLVASRLEPTAKSLGLHSIEALVTQLRKGLEKELVRKVVESLATHETSFFRDNEPFEILRQSVLPEILNAQRHTRELTIWCGAASSGQEPYSLCMMLREHFPELLTWKLKFIASDLSNAILEKAKAGVYSQVEVNRGLPVRFLVKYFDKVGQQWVVKEEMRKMVEFFEQNLLHPYTRVPKVDLLMLRNVLIYFDVETKREILRKIRAVMKPHSYLFLGTAETTINIDENFERVAFQKTSCYRIKTAK